MLQINEHKIITTACDSNIVDDVAEYTFTIIKCSIGKHDLSFEIQGEINNPVRWVINHALEELIHHCGHYDLIKYTSVPDEEYHMMLCEDDFFDDEIVKKGGRDIRTEICNYNDDMCYKSDMFFVYYQFLKDKVDDEIILHLYNELLNVQDEVDDKYEEYDNFLREYYQPISLVKFIKGDYNE